MKIRIQPFTLGQKIQGMLVGLIWMQMKWELLYSKCVSVRVNVIGILKWNNKGITQIYNNNKQLGGIYISTVLHSNIKNTRLRYYRAKDKLYS